MRKNKNVLFRGGMMFLCAVMMFSFSAFAQTENAAEAAGADYSGEIEGIKSSIAGQEKEIKDIAGQYKELGDTLKNAKETINTMQAEIDIIKTDIKSLEERSMEIKHLMKNVSEHRLRIENIEEKHSENREKLNETVMKFSEIELILEKRINKMESWDDIIGILKREISNNEREIARLKKSVDEMQSMYGGSGNFFDSIAQWPYTGITALAVSLISFAVIIAR
ncbi:MAG: hypothetical protein ACLFP1_03510 [Candidatus Goldiibacteriota bacterium]